MPPPDRRSRYSETYCTCITTGDSGPDARVVQPIGVSLDAPINVGASVRSRKLAQISHSGTAVLMYLDPRKNAGVAVHTRAVISTDAAVRQASFPVAFRAFWPDGPDDPDFAVAACTPVAVEVWDPSRRITPPPFGLIGARIERAEAGWTLVDSWRAGTDR